MGLIIVGAGMAGLLAANMLRHHDPVVVEAQESLPHNHGAVLRFSSTVVADTLGLEFKEVNLVKSVLPWANPVADAMAYSRKCLGQYRTDRSPVLSERTSSHRRYIAPTDLIERMARGVKIQYGVKWDFGPYSPEQGIVSDKVLSTIPMPALMKALGYPRKIEFGYVHGTNITARIRGCDAYASLVIPSPDEPYSRISITGDELVAEIPRPMPQMDSVEKLAVRAANLVGFSRLDVYDVSQKHQDYYKIAPIDEDERRRFIHWASTITGRAWQLGRFATWRPGLLLDDLVHDVRQIDKWMRSDAAGYSMDENRIK